MSYSIVSGDITEMEVDIIVNASNGIGYMGGTIGKHKKLIGVAEAIHFKTQGEVEKEAIAKCRKSRFIPRRITGGFKAGSVFTTKAGSLSAKYILHAVTMPFPGMKTDIGVVKELLPEIFRVARELEAKTIAIPLLGTGTGGVNKQDVLELYKEYLGNIEDMHVSVVTYHKE